MNFSQMHEHLRLELLRRIRRGTLSVSLLARQTGYGQSHLSNFLRNRRQLSLEALDQVLFCQHMSVQDLLPGDAGRRDAAEVADIGRIPIVSHASALSDRIIRPSNTQGILHVPGPRLQAIRTRPSNNRYPWQRFVAISISAEDASPMYPILLPNAVLLLDRHYNSLLPYRSDRTNIYALSNGGRLVLRYLDFQVDRLVLRPHNVAFSVDLLDIPPGETPFDMIAGRVALALNEI